MAPIPPNSGKAGRSNNSSQNDEERNVDPGAAFRIQSGVEQTESTFTNGNCGNFTGNFRHSARVSDAQATRYAQQVPIQKPQSSNPQDIVIKVNCHFQHLNSHLLSKCKRCQEAWKLYSHPTGCSLNNCDKCSFVKSTVGYHKRVCRMECNLCLGKLSLGRQENPVQVVDGNEEGATCQAISRACGTSSLDHDQSEKVVASLSSEKILPRTFTLPENHIFHHTNICVMEKLFQELVGKYFVQDVHYEVCPKLGQGGNGQVFAVKLLPRGKSKLDGIFKDNDLAVKKANVRPNEMKVLKKLYNSQYFAQCYFIVHKEEQVRWKDRTRNLTKRMFVKKYDGSLSQHLDEHGPPELEDAMFFWIQVLLGVSYLHRLVPPIIHKDIKAGNVLLDDGLARLADFEYAVILDDDIKTEELPRCGTPFFVSPEVVKKDPHGPPADVYGMGALFLEIMFKKRGGLIDKKFRSDKDCKDSLVRRLKKLDPALGELIGSCLEEDPSLRPTAVELLESDVVQEYIKSLQLSRIHPVLSGL